MMGPLTGRAPLRRSLPQSRCRRRCQKSPLAALADDTTPRARARSRLGYRQYEEAVVHKSHLYLALGLVIGGLVTGEIGGQVPPGCTPQTTLTVNDGMTSAPDISVSSFPTQAAWNSAQQFAIAFSAQNGHDPYPSKTCPDPTHCYSCAQAPGMTSPINYTITFTASNKKINGRIIIKALGK
jgi:hypothetical protein